MSHSLENKKITNINSLAGFSLLEVLVSIAIFSLMLLAMISFLSSMYGSYSKTKAGSQSLENAQRAMDIMAYEIKGARSIYTPTTTQNQLSLQVPRYLPSDETITFIDFFLCGSALCLKKESQSPIALTSDSVQVAALVFSQALNGSTPSVTIAMTVNYINPTNSISSSAATTLTSTVALRSY